MAFFNCGWDSGASQKHCHLQCIEIKRSDLQNSDGAAAEGQDGAGEEEDEEEGLVPIEKLLARIEGDGKDDGERGSRHRC